MPHKSKRQKKGAKKQYKVRNWREYNQALVDRGKVIFWITEEAIKAWEEKQRKGKRGRPMKYSELAIETAVSLQQLFRLPLRQAEGLLGTMLLKLGTKLSAPDYSTVSLRGEKLSVSLRAYARNKEAIHLVVDSTGAKVYGEGEWKVRQHGWSKHRTWRKLHLGVDEETKEILVGEVTGNERTDSEVLPVLLSQLPEDTKIEQVSGDGGYDKRMCYEELQRRGVTRIAIPPQHNAKIWQHGNKKALPLPRDENLRRIRAVGRKRWKEEINYHRRSIAETTMFRLKTIFGDRVSARKLSGQTIQLLMRLKLLNQMTTIGMPQTVVVA